MPQTLTDAALVSPVLIGRAQPLNTLAQRMEQARAGRGQTVLLAGEAGIGKTRLVTEVARLAAHSGLVRLDGHCFEPDHAVPFAPLLDVLQTAMAAAPDQDAGLRRALGPAALAALLPELAPAGPPPALAEPLPVKLEKRRLFNALAQGLLAAERAGPRLIVIEDLHWSDETSLAFLLYFARHLASEPVLLLLTYRNDDLPLPLAQFLAELDRERLATELTLDRLRPAELDEWLRAVFQLAQPARPVCWLPFRPPHTWFYLVVRNPNSAT